MLGSTGLASASRTRHTEVLERDVLGRVRSLTHVVPSVGNEFVEPFRYCQGAAIRGLAGKIVPSEFAEARVAFEKLETLFDSLWVDEPGSVALRGYLAGIGFCLGWLETMEELIP